MSDQDQEKNVLTPVEDSEVEAWTNSLDENSKLEIRRQALQLRAVQQAAKEPPNFGRMSDAELAEYTRKNFGF